MNDRIVPRGYPDELPSDVEPQIQDGVAINHFPRLPDDLPLDVEPSSWRPKYGDKVVIEERETEPVEGAQMLEEAAQVIRDRQSVYGPPTEDFERIAALIEAVLTGKLKAGEHITKANVAQIMICVKLSRLTESPDHDDSWRDIGGYAGCGYHVTRD